MPVCVAYLAIYAFVKARTSENSPRAPVFSLGSVALDSVGNLRFGGSQSMYDTKFEYLQYDGFARWPLALVAPVIVWLRAGLDRFGYRLLLIGDFLRPRRCLLSPAFTRSLSCGTTSIAWPAPGMRIHGSYDTATDLQCDLIGITVGGLMAYVILKRQRVAVQVAA